MITLDAFDVRPAGAISRHAAASAAAHQRIAAAKTQRPWIGPLPT
ncbi:hypothetical protein [Mycobacterium sp.]